MILDSNIKTLQEADPNLDFNTKTLQDAHPNRASLWLRRHGPY